MILQTLTWKVSDFNVFWYMLFYSIISIYQLQNTVFELILTVKSTPVFLQLYVVPWYGYLLSFISIHLETVLPVLLLLFFTVYLWGHSGEYSGHYCRCVGLLQYFLTHICIKQAYLFTPMLITVLKMWKSPFKVQLELNLFHLSPKRLLQFL